jgi:LemA protein
MSTIVVILLIVVIAVLVLYAIVTYNGLVRQRNEVEEAYWQIDVQLKRRYNIPNLLENVKKYFRQEQEVLREMGE